MASHTIIPSYEIEKRIQQVRPYISIDHSTYVNTHTKCRFIDSEYGAWNALPGNVLKGAQHPVRNNKLMKQRLTQSSHEVERRIQLKSPYVSIDHGTYVNTHTRCRFIDSEYGDFYKVPSDVIRGCGHISRKLKKFRNTVVLSSYEIEKRIQKVFPHISVDHLSYSDTRTKCRFIDSEYGEWFAVPNNILNGGQHPTRTKGHKKITVDEVIRRIAVTHPYLTLDVSTYIDTVTKCRFIDSEYGEWWTRPNGIFSGNDHPSRSNCGSSAGEKELAKFVSDNDTIEENYRVKIDSKTFELDLFIPILNIGIEYHGLYWHSEKHKPYNYHFQKREFFEKQGIQLLQFYENEWRDKQDIVKSIILSKIGKSELKYQSRKLQLKQVTNKDAQQFLQNNHLMGGHKTAKYIGLFDGNELVSLLGYKRIKDGIDISRFCNKLNTSVAGSYSKLLKYIEINEKPAFIQSFVDLRYGNGKALEKIGFKLEKVTQGWNWTGYKTIYNRLYCRANMDDRKLTEKQHAEELQLVKIYDAGQAKYKKTYLY